MPTTTSYVTAPYSHYGGTDLGRNPKTTTTNTTPTLTYQHRPPRLARAQQSCDDAHSRQPSYGTTKKQATSSNKLATHFVAGVFAPTHTPAVIIPKPDKVKMWVERQPGRTFVAAAARAAEQSSPGSHPSRVYGAAMRARAGEGTP